MNPKIAELQKQYADAFEITESGEWVNVKSLKPIYDKFQAIDGPAFLDYTIMNGKSSPGVSLEDRSRNVWLRDQKGIGFQSVSYCQGLGIWQVTQKRTDGPIPEKLPENLEDFFEPIAASELSQPSLQSVGTFLRNMDKYVFVKIPELRQILQE